MRIETRTCDCICCVDACARVCVSKFHCLLYLDLVFKTYTLKRSRNTLTNTIVLTYTINYIVLLLLFCYCDHTVCVQSFSFTTLRIFLHEMLKHLIGRREKTTIYIIRKNFLLIKQKCQLSNDLKSFIAWRLLVLFIT